jgi:hypothetical protein
VCGNGLGASFAFKEGFGLCLYLSLSLPHLYRVNSVLLAYLVDCLDTTYRFKTYFGLELWQMCSALF